MNVPYNEKTKHIYETVARIAREIAAKEADRKRPNPKTAENAA